MYRIKCRSNISEKNLEKKTKTKTKTKKKIQAKKTIGVFCCCLFEKKNIYIKDKYRYLFNQNKVSVTSSYHYEKGINNRQMINYQFEKEKKRVWQDLIQQT